MASPNSHPHRPPADGMFPSVFPLQVIFCVVTILSFLVIGGSDVSGIRSDASLCSTCAAGGTNCRWPSLGVRVRVRHQTTGSAHEGTIVFSVLPETVLD